MSVYDVHVASPSSPDGDGGRSMHHHSSDTEAFAGSFVDINSNATHGYSRDVHGYRGIRGYPEGWSPPDDEQRRDAHTHEEQGHISLQQDEGEVHWRPRERQVIREGGQGAYQRCDDAFPQHHSAVSDTQPDFSPHWDPPRN